MRINKNWLIPLLFLASGALIAEGEEVSENEEPPEEAQPSVMERLKAIEEVDPKEWGIRRGCVNLSRVRNIDFKDDQTAVITMAGRKKILLRLQKECPGIEHNGFVHQTRTNQLCAKFDTLRVLRSGFVCPIESLEPYIAIEEPKPEKKKKKSKKDDE